MELRTLWLSVVLVTALSACTPSKFSSVQESAVLSKSVMGNGSLAQSLANEPTSGSSSNQVNEQSGDNPFAGFVGQPAGSPPASGAIGQPAAPPAAGNLGQPISSGFTMPSMPSTGALGQPTLPPAAGNLGQPITSLPGASDPIAQINNADGVVPVTYVCAAAFMNSTSIYLKPELNGAVGTVAIKVNGTACSASSADILAQLKAKKFDLKALCPSVTFPISSLEIDVNGSANVALPANDAVSKLITMSARTGVPVVYADPHSMDSTISPDSLCDTQADPLVVHMTRSEPAALNLSAPKFGIRYDILGRKNHHVPLQISWFTSQEYGLLALPDANGAVRGIDQLFGDNTFGPDRQFASNGYAALAKYDSNGDGVIDSKDPVYSRLRVWVDRDRNGVASASELLTLQQADIAYISLHYSTDYRETDAYGNTANMKSVLGRLDGSLDIIFDLWFKYSAY